MDQSENFAMFFENLFSADSLHVPGFIFAWQENCHSVQALHKFMSKKVKMLARKKKEAKRRGLGLFMPAFCW